MTERFHEVVAAVRDQYERYPYPPVVTLEEEDPRRDLRASFNMEHGLTGARALRSGARVWIPGCGTRWAVMCALQLSDVSIVATDLSEASLHHQERLSRALGIDNIEFRREDILTARYEHEFDLISCVGVLHHLPDPRRGFEIIGRALKPTGIAEVMVYDEWNRHYSMRMGRIIDAFGVERGAGPEERFSLATRVLRTTTRYARTPRELPDVLQELERSPLFARELADFVSHPEEHYFDVPSLVEHLALGGLAPVSWKMPHLFDPCMSVSDPALHERARSLDPVARAHLGHLLSNCLLEVFAGTPAASAGRADDPSARRVRAIPSSRTMAFAADGAVAGASISPKIVRHRDERRFDGGDRRPLVKTYGLVTDCVRMVGRRPFALGEVGSATPLTMEHVARVIEMASTPTTIAEIARAIESELRVPQVDVVELCDLLCRTPYRVLAVC